MLKNPRYLSYVPAALISEEPVDEDPWPKAYLQSEKAPQEHTIMVTDEDEVAFAQEPRQAILIVGPNGPGGSGFKIPHLKNT